MKTSLPCQLQQSAWKHLMTNVSRVLEFPSTKSDLKNWNQRVFLWRSRCDVPRETLLRAENYHSIQSTSSSQNIRIDWTHTFGRTLPQKFMLRRISKKPGGTVGVDDQFQMERNGYDHWVVSKQAKKQNASNSACLLETRLCLALHNICLRSSLPRVSSQVLIAVPLVWFCNCS